MTERSSTFVEPIIGCGVLHPKEHPLASCRVCQLTTRVAQLEAVAEAAQALRDLYRRGMSDRLTEKAWMVRALELAQDLKRDVPDPLTSTKAQRERYARTRYALQCHIRDVPT